MYISQFFSTSLLFSLVLSCPELDFSSEGHLVKRATAATEDWSYDASFDWGQVSPEYGRCQNGTNQSPIPLLITQGLSLYHQPTIRLPPSVTGTFLNWGHGPAFSLNTTGNGTYANGPSVTFDEDGRNITVYLKGWHIHSPADHSVQGDHSKSELHMVFSNAEGLERAVFAIRIDPGNAVSGFFKQLPSYISFRDRSHQIPNTKIDVRLAFNEVNNFSEFWTYRGSLTSPPCREGIRWYVARNILFVSNEQQQAILGVSTYSARAEQQVWLHAINV